MVAETDLKEIKPKATLAVSSSAHVQTGIPVPKSVRIKNFSPGEWEDFVEEWASGLENTYVKVRRLGGTGDLGVDVVGFCTDSGFEGAWDNYQCKRYANPLRPSEIWVELGKIIYYSFSGEYNPPRKHYFVASNDIGTKLEKLLNNPSKLCIGLKDNWDGYCKRGITSTREIELSGTLLSYLDEFDFRIFSSKSHQELIEAHSQTTFHAIRFGGGLPQRPTSQLPPNTPTASESRYIRQLLDAYEEHLGCSLPNLNSLDEHAMVKNNFKRQRERFYHAEALKNFARDTVPEGTFEELQDEIFHGVVDISEGSYLSGFDRMQATIAQASNIALTASPLVSVTKLQDRQGVCHQLANQDRLKWVMK